MTKLIRCYHMTHNDLLRSFARNFRVCLAIICYLAWALVLAKACGREQVVFGIVPLGRSQAGVKIRYRHVTTDQHTTNTNKY